MIRVTRKRLIVTTVVLLLLAGILVVTWRVCDWPPPRLILKYGFPLAGGVTGKSRRGPRGLEYAEVPRGYCRASRPVYDDPGDAIGRTCLRLGIPFGHHPIYGDGYRREWVEVEDSFWISTVPIPNDDALLGEPSKSDLHMFEPICRSLTAEGHGRVRLPTEQELFLASEHGVAGSQGLSFAAAFSAGEGFTEVLYGSGWCDLEELTSETVLKALVEDHSVLYLIWDAGAPHGRVHQFAGD